MADESGSAAQSDSPNRRGFIKGATVVATAALACSLDGGLAYADALTREQRDKMTPEEIIAVMKTGNVRFRSGEKATRNYLAEQRAAANGQYPAAVVLSCIDSRAPAEVMARAVEML